MKETDNATERRQKDFSEDEEKKRLLGNLVASLRQAKEKERKNKNEKPGLLDFLKIIPCLLIFLLLYIIAYIHHIAIAIVLIVAIVYQSKEGICISVILAGLLYWKERKSYQKKST